MGRINWIVDRHWGGPPETLLMARAELGNRIGGDTGGQTRMLTRSAKSLMNPPLAPTRGRCW